MSAAPQLFPKGTLPRTKRQVRMHVIDAGDHGCGGVEPGEQWVKYGCSSCSLETEWQSAKNISEARKGIPCPICNTEEGTTIMTHSGGKPHTNVGDKGQRYEVRAYKANTGEQVVIGWTNEADGGKLLEGVKIWPAMRDPFVTDRQKLDECLESAADL